ncbi:MAG: hypothetical protein AB1938_04730 [Myxococcota bacterium]
MRTLLSLLTLLSCSALADGHEHAHEGGSALSKLTLNAGKRWQTDAQLQKAMAVIRDDVQAAIEPIHAGKFAAKDYEALAGRIEKQVAGVISKCKLPPEVDAQFHLVLADVVSGVATMKKAGDRTKGVVQVIEALQAYPTYFEHPGWKPIQH